MNLAAGEAKRATVQPISSGSPKCRIGVRPRTLALRSGLFPKAVRLKSVRTHPGAMALMRTPCPDHSVARVRTNPSCAVLAAA